LTLTEYIYIDRARLDSYFQQISSPLTFDKVPGWKVNLSLTGPGVEGTQTAQVRPYTDHEKFTAVLNHLYASSSTRPPELNPYTNFVFESLDATPILIPSTNCKGRDSITLWIATAQGATRGFRFLIEDFRRSDAEQPALSGFSCLQVMLDEFSESIGDFLSTNIDRYAGELPRDRTLSLPSDNFSKTLFPLSEETVRAIKAVLSIAGIQTEGLRVLDCTQNTEEKDFIVGIGNHRYVAECVGSQITIRRLPMTELSTLMAADPLQVFRKWGAKIGSKRSLDALYRVRQCSTEAFVIPRGQITTVGYPIVLLASPSPFTSKYRAGTSDDKS
jgi:hypothetical protein